MGIPLLPPLGPSPLSLGSSSREVQARSLTMYCAAQKLPWAGELQELRNGVMRRHNTAKQRLRDGHCCNESIVYQRRRDNIGKEKRCCCRNTPASVSAMDIGGYRDLVASLAVVVVAVMIDDDGFVPVTANVWRCRPPAVPVPVRTRPAKLS